LATDIGSGTAFAASAASFGAINLTVGVLVNQAMRALLHQLFRDRGALPS
jgi:hypothetical protein